MIVATLFLQTQGRQEVSARLSSLSGMFAAYVDLPQLGLPRLGPFSPFIGAVETDEGIARVVNRAGNVLAPLTVGRTRAHLSSHGMWLSLRYAFYTL